MTAAAVMAALFMASSLFAENVALRLVLLAASTMVAAVAAWRNRHALRLLPPIWIPFALWAAWALLSLAWSIEPARTLKEWRNEVVYPALALWVAFIGAQAPAAHRIFPPLVALASVAACAVALYEYRGGLEAYLDGWHGGPGSHSSALLALMPCAAMAAWLVLRRSAPLFVRIVPLVLIGLYVASAYTTLNRTIWLGFIVQLLLLALLLGSRLAVVPQTARRYTLFTAATVIALAGAAASVLILVQEQRQAMGASPIEGDTRLALWPVIAQYIEQRPLTGYGFGRGLLREALGAKLGAIDAHLWHAHNYFLEALIQVGVPGLLLILVLVGATVRYGWMLARDAHEAVAACGIALVCVVAGMLIRNMTDTLLVRQSALLYWALVGALLGAGFALRSRRACDSSAVDPGGRYSGIQRRS